MHNFQQLIKYSSWLIPFTLPRRPRKNVHQSCQTFPVKLAFRRGPTSVKLAFRRRQNRRNDCVIAKEYACGRKQCALLPSRINDVTIIEMSIAWFLAHHHGCIQLQVNNFSATRDRLCQESNQVKTISKFASEKSEQTNYAAIVKSCVPANDEIRLRSQNCLNRYQMNSGQW